MHESFFLKCLVYFCYHCILLYIKLPSFFRKLCGVLFCVLLSCPGVQGVQFLRPRSPLKDMCVYFQHLDCWTVIGAEKHPHHCGFIAPLHPSVSSSYFSLIFSSFFSSSSSLFFLISLLHPPFIYSSSASPFFHFFCPSFSLLSFSFFPSSFLKVLSTCRGNNLKNSKNNCVVCVCACACLFQPVI